jgi:RNA polymerase sigma-70 factor (ECF subfamily)
MDLSAETDENLMARFGRGDAAAFEVLYRRHESKVFRYLFRCVRDQSGANDLMQDVWFAVARNAQRYEPRAKFTTWLFTLAHNRMIDAVRKVRPMQSLDESVGEDPESGSLADRIGADPGREPPAEVQTQVVAAALLDAVGKLPAEQRTAFLLQAEGGLSLEDIAAATGSSFETVKSRLRYARAKLRQLLWEFA